MQTAKETLKKSFEGAVVRKPLLITDGLLMNDREDEPGEEPEDELEAEFRQLIDRHTI